MSIKKFFDFIFPNTHLVGDTPISPSGALLHNSRCRRLNDMIPESFLKKGCYKKLNINNIIQLYQSLIGQFNVKNQGELK